MAVVTHVSGSDVHRGIPLRSGVKYTATPNGHTGLGMFMVTDPVFRIVTTTSTTVGPVPTMAERPS
jgi:hypothetical protein